MLTFGSSNVASEKFEKKVLLKPHFKLLNHHFKLLKHHLKFYSSGTFDLCVPIYCLPSRLLCLATEILLAQPNETIVLDGSTRIWSPLTTQYKKKENFIALKSETFARQLKKDQNRCISDKSYGPSKSVLEERLRFVLFRCCSFNTNIMYCPELCFKT